MLISLGLDHGIAPVGVRERFHRSECEIRELYSARGQVLPEVVFVSTCNRLELYGWVPTGTDLTEALTDLARSWIADEEDCREFLKIAEARTEADAARHLLRVASGLESQVLGDIHILGQLRSSFRLAASAGAPGPHLQRLFDTVFRAGKAVRRETDLMAGRSSVGSEAAGLAARAARSVERPLFAVVGCGKLGGHAAHSLAERHHGSLLLINRTPCRALELADDLKATTATWDDRYRALARVDAVIVATGASEPILDLAELDRARSEAGTDERPLLVIDVSMPRNVCGESGRLDSGISLIDLDALEPETASVERARHAAVPQAEALIEAELDKLFAWLAGEPAREALRPLREALAEICLKEIAFAADDAIADRTAGRIVAKLLAGPMGELRRACVAGDSVDDVARTVALLFGPRTADELATHAP